MTESTNKNKKFSTLYKHIGYAELYQFYPHKYRDVTSKTVLNRPYVKAEDISDHKYKLDFKSWKLIIETYMDLLWNDVLMQGFLFRIPERMGLLRLMKRKYNKVTEETDVTIFKAVNKYLDGYFVQLIWHTGTAYKFNLKNKTFFKVRISTTRYRKMFQIFKKNRSLLYNLAENANR